MMKVGRVIPYLKNIQKYMNHVTEPLDSAKISVFSPEIRKYCYIKKYRYRLHFDAWFLILFTFLEPLKIALINTVIILMMSAEVATVVLLRIKLLSRSHWKCTSRLQKHDFVCLYSLFSCMLCFHVGTHVCFHLISNVYIVRTFENRISSERSKNGIT